MPRETGAESQAKADRRSGRVQAVAWRILRDPASAPVAWMPRFVHGHRIRLEMRCELLRKFSEAHKRFCVWLADSK